MAALALGIPGAACLAWWLAIGRTFGGRVGSQAGLGVLSFGQAIRSFGWPRLLDALAMWNGTWWQGVGVGLSFGPTIMYTLLTIPFLALVVGGLWTLAGGPGHALPPRARFAAIVLAVGAIPLFYATIARQAFASVSLDASARFTLPAAPILALLVAIGASRLPLGRFRRPLGLGYLAALLTLSVVTPLVFFPDLAIPVVPARLPANAQEAHGPAIARFANGIDLLAVSAPAALTAGQPLPITLHWRVERTPPDNAIAYVHLVGPAGRRLAGSDAIPLEKTYAPTLWQAGEIVDERRSLAAPSQLTPGNYRLDVGLYHLDPTGTRITPVPLEPAGPPDEAATAVRWQILPDASGLASASPISASFGPRLTLLADRVDLAGSTASARLYWKATAPIARRLVVSVQALDARGRLVAQNDSEPAGGLLPTTTWRPGDVIADDHRIQLPAGADPPSSYIVAVYDRQTLARLDVTESGRPAGDHVTLAITPVVAARAQSR